MVTTAMAFVPPARLTGARAHTSDWCPAVRRTRAVASVVTGQRVPPVLTLDARPGLGGPVAFGD